MKNFTLPTVLLLIPAFLIAGNPVKNHLGFRENKGQIAGADGKSATAVLFKTTGTAPGIFITNSGITYVFYKKEENSAAKEAKEIKWSKVEMFLEGANISADHIKMEDALPGVCNFYYPHCPEGVLDIKTWKKVTVSEVYPGIDWILNADDQKGLSYDFVVHPGADASKINILYKGASSISLRENNTKVILRSLYGEITEGALNVFEKGSKKIEASFKVHNKEVSYSIGPYNEKYELIIDPPLLWSQRETSSGLDYGNAVVAPRDGTGDAVITGFSGATDFPTLNAYQGSSAGNDDIVILRLSGTGTMLWSTYYGGSGSESGKGIGADVAGNCYVAGVTGSANFPTLNALYTALQGGVNDVALLKFNNLGVRQWATYYGSTNNDFANAIVTDPAGNSYITGYTNSPNFPVLNALQPTKNVNNDAFIMKVNASLTVQWATFMGGDDDDKGRGITLDMNAANVFITGTTVGQFSVTAGAFQNTNASLYNVEDMFVVKLNASTSAMVYSTLCGTPDTDIPEDIAVDNAGNAYVTGYTFSDVYPIFNPGGGAYVDSTIGSLATHDAVVTKFNPTGTAVLWSTYLGGSAVDMGLGICYDPNYGIYVTGATASTDFPTQMPSDNVYYQSVQGDGGLYNDFFIAWFTTAGIMKWSTYYGDANGNEGRGIDTDAQSNIFVCGADSNCVKVLKFAPGNLTAVASVNTTNNLLKLYPVPAQNTITLETEMQKAGTVKVEIWNAEGLLIRKEILQANAGTNNFSFDISQLPAGNYSLKLVDAEKESVNKFVKVK